MKNFLLPILLFFISLSASAVPALREWKTIIQSDGSQIKVMLVGDEHFHYYKTTDGLPLIRTGNDFFYASINNGHLKASSYLAHNVSDRSANEFKLVKESFKPLDSNSINSMIRRSPLNSSAVRRIGVSNGPYEGNYKGLIILVSFQDCDFIESDPKTTFYDMANQEGYNENGAVGSIHDYFNDQSNGKFNITFDVCGPVKLPYNESYYGSSTDGDKDNYPHITEMVKFAVEAVSDTLDLAKYDWDGDKKVDQVIIVFAGHPESSGAPEYTIWPHESSISLLGEEPDTINGIVIDQYCCSSELAGSTGSELSGLGTLCHEFSHCLGLPDMYDTSNTGYASMDRWDVMDQGNYNNGGWTPAGYTSYERNFCGWLDYKELKDSMTVTGMKPLIKGGDAYVFYNPNFTDEYYLLENRNQTSWDGGLFNSGLLIIHVNYNKTNWQNNRVNAGQAGMTIFHADNSFQTSTIADRQGDVYPYLQQSPYRLNDMLTDYSTPSDTLWHRNSDGMSYMHIAITNIKKSGRNISFKFKDLNKQADAINDVHASDEGLTEYFSLEGVRQSKTLASGIYIERNIRSGKTRKIFVR